MVEASARSITFFQCWIDLFLKAFMFANGQYSDVLPLRAVRSAEPHPALMLAICHGIRSGPSCQCSERKLACRALLHFSM